jgi:hypothetical protein
VIHKGAPSNGNHIRLRYQIACRFGWIFIFSGMLFNDPEIFRALTQLLDKWEMPNQGNVLSSPTAGQNFGCIDLHHERFIHIQHGVDRGNTDGGFQWLC